MNRETYLTMLYEENRDLLYAVSRKEVNYQARYHELIEDCIQETFAIATSRWEQLIHHPNIRGWLMKTCLNLLKDRQRQYQLRQQILTRITEKADPNHSAWNNTYEQYLDDEAARYYLEKLKAGLTSDERIIWTAYFLEQRTMKSIAEQLHLTENRVKNHVKRIRRKAKKLFASINL